MILQDIKTSVIMSLCRDRSKISDSLISLIPSEPGYDRRKKSLETSLKEIDSKIDRMIKEIEVESNTIRNLQTKGKI